MEQNPAYRPTPNAFPAWAIILAAGSGSRMGKVETPKQFLIWRGRPLYWHGARAFARSACVDGIVFVFPEAYVEVERERLQEMAKRDSLGLPFFAVAGGHTRQASSANGLAAVPRAAKLTLVHDAARPFVQPELIRAVCGAISAETPCVVPAVPVADTIRLLAPEGDVAERALPRARLAACQTPQGFWAETLREAQRKCAHLNVTDDAAMLEALGWPAHIISGDPQNCKITLPRDLQLLERENTQPLPCSGFGYDVHRFGEGGRELRIGGVLVPSALRVIAHSDGDVLLHALMDALLGMAALGDIGMHFPDNDAQYEGIASVILLDSVMELLRGREIRLCHVDLTVVAQKPKLAPYAQAIRANVSQLLGLAEDCVNFKATTEEKLGFTGKCEGIKAYALASGLRFCGQG